MGRTKVTSADELARCAVRIVARDGLSRLAARAVAEEAGVALGTLYRHVHDLTHLVAIAAAAVEADFVADLRRAAPEYVPLRPAIPDIAQAVVGRALATPRLVELLTLPAASTMHTDGAGIRNWISGRIAHAVRAGDVGPCDPHLVAAAAFGMVRGVLEDTLTRNADPAQAQRLAATGLAALLPTADSEPTAPPSAGRP